MEVVEDLEVELGLLMTLMVRNDTADADADADVTETKKISRVESLKNLILHGKTEPDLPPEVFNFPHGCSCR